MTSSPSAATAASAAMMMDCRRRACVDSRHVSFYATAPNWPDTASVRSKPPQTAAIYARISHDPSGERLGVKRQEADCCEEAARRGWTVADVYVDDDLSAYSARKPRPEY